MMPIIPVHAPERTAKHAPNVPLHEQLYLNHMSHDTDALLSERRAASSSTSNVT